MLFAKCFLQDTFRLVQLLQLLILQLSLLLLLLFLLFLLLLLLMGSGANISDIFRHSPLSYCV